MQVVKVKHSVCASPSSWARLGGTIEREKPGRDPPGELRMNDLLKLRLLAAVLREARATVAPCHHVVVPRQVAIVS